MEHISCLKSHRDKPNSAVSISDSLAISYRQTNNFNREFQPTICVMVFNTLMYSCVAASHTVEFTVPSRSWHFANAVLWCQAPHGMVPEGAACHWRPIKLIMSGNIIIRWICGYAFDRTKTDFHSAQVS